MPMYHYQRPSSLEGIVYNIPPRQTKAEQEEERRERMERKAEKIVKALTRLSDKIVELERQGKVMHVDFEVQTVYRDSKGNFVHHPARIVMLKPVG